MDKESDLISKLQNQSESVLLDEIKPRERNLSEISAWDDFSQIITVSNLKEKKKKRHFIPSDKIIIKRANLIPILPRKPTQLTIRIEQPVLSKSLETKLPIIKGTRSPIYKYLGSYESISKKSFIIKNTFIQPIAQPQSALKFIPRSIKNIKSPLHITSLLKGEVMRSLSSTKKNYPYY